MTLQATLEKLPSLELRNFGNIFSNVTRDAKNRAVGGEKLTNAKFDIIDLFMRRSLLVSILCFPLVGAECSFVANREDFLQRQSRAVQSVYHRTLQAKLTPKTAIAASDAPRRNFIDSEIFRKLELSNVPAAELSNDAEFLRRISLDLTGRLPTPSEIRAFLGDSAPNKRDAAIDKLLDSAAFIDKWTMWFGDLLENCSFPALFDRREDGRNAYNSWIRKSVTEKKPIRQMAFDLVTATGNHYDAEAGATNFPITGKTSMGPAQDTYDNMLVKASTYFLGMAQYDCLLCHNGRGHLDQINLWGARRTRLEAQQMAAFFSRLNMPSKNVPTTDFYYFSYDVSDKTSGTYDLNTNSGNRPDRPPVGTLKNLTPVYRTGETATEDWRTSFGRRVWRDRMFARNFANRLWREMFGMGLVEPFDMLDPDRLDPANPPPEPWTLQASHPELFEKLTDSFIESDYSLRDFLRLLVQSNAYQMSSRYDAPWKPEYVTLFARHYPRRMMAEEIHDAIALATGVRGNYPVKNLKTPATLAMEFAEPGEPRTDGNVATFLNMFLRGNRDSQPRSQELSILQRLYIMIDQFVTNRLKVATAPGLQAVAKITDNTTLVDEIFLLFLSRSPSDSELETARGMLTAAKTTAERNAAIEDLAWVCVNKAEFLFSY